MNEPDKASKIGFDDQHEHPFLFPWNRRIRNLHGISIRNLNITPSIGRSRGATSADDDLPYSLSSPAKILMRDEAIGLSHSRSLSDLKSSLKPSLDHNKKAKASHLRNDGKENRTERGRLRRRSTLHWSNTHPRVRQKKLDEVISARLAYAWFSIHSKYVSDPVYISETMGKSMNPSFAYFDLDDIDSKIAREEELTIRLWAKDEQMDEFSLLVDLDLDMRSLQYVGRSLENFHHPLPQNCILLHLSDGIYTSFTDLAEDSQKDWLSTQEPKASHKLNSSTFDALMQLANLDECIQDALRIRKQLEAEIDLILVGGESGFKREKTRIEYQEKARAITSAIKTEQKSESLISKHATEMKSSLRFRQQTIEEGQGRYQKINRQITEIRKKNSTLSDTILRDEVRSRGQIRRIAETLMKIFPIEPIKNKTLQFTIRSIYLPNSVFDDTNRDEIAAALGFTTQLVHHLSFYLSTPLPYPLEPNSSNSYIRDPISVGLTERKFPLYPTTVGYKFEYGVFLLNKDIEFLMNRADLRVLDIRHTLPNLKYLLYILTAGSGDLPIRKAGGVRGLLGTRLTPAISRRSSEESVVIQKEHGKRSSGDQMWNGSIPQIVDPREKLLSQTETLSFS